MEAQNGSGAATACTVEPRSSDGKHRQPPNLHTVPHAINQSILRPHQVDLVAKINAEIASGGRRIVAQAPTGFGKTIVAAVLTREELAKGNRTIIVVPTLSLINQTVERLFKEGITDVGVMQARHPMTNWGRLVQVASVQTLMRRGIPDADLVIIDEAHRWYDLYETWMNGAHWADVPFIGLTATPWTRGLGRYYDALIVGSTTKELINDGYLSRFRVFAPASPDLSGVRDVAGDYHEGDLRDAMDKDALVADVVDTWMQRGQHRPTLCFAVDRLHAKHLQTKFQAAGVSAGYVDAYTEPSERSEIEKKFRSGEIKVVCNVGCLTTGIDWDVRCIILARPTKSEMLFVQMIGRGLRTADGKDDLLILDHSDNHTRLGFVTDIHHDELDDGKPKPKAERKPQEALPKKCPECTFLKPATLRKCPNCGFTPEPKNTVVHRDGELVELSDRRKAVAMSKTDQARFYQELNGYAANRGYNPGWIAHKFKEKYGHWPKGLKDLPAVDPTPATLSWIKSRQIAYARSHAR